MLRKLLIAIAPIALWASLTAETMYSTGIAGRTGAPGETNCSACHTGSAVNAAGGSITLNNPSMPGNVYTPGQTYSMSITVARTGINLFGFGLVALTASNQNAGTINVTDAASTQIKSATIAGVLRRNLVHTAGGGSGSGSKTFNFSWTAPALGTGTVTFYFAGNAANGNTFSSGDYIYTGSLALTEAPCNVPATPAGISGTSVFCSGTSAVLSVAADPSATGYTWTLPTGWSGSSTTNSITVTAGTTSGNITVTADNACGSSPASVLPVTATTVSAPTITFVNDTLVSSLSGNLQWYLNGSPLSGATGQWYLPTVNGDYTVTITDITSGCSGTSPVYTYLSTALLTTYDIQPIKLYPVPADAYLLLESGESKEGIPLIIIDAFGRKVFETVSTSVLNRIDTQDLPSGTYLLYFNSQHYRFSVQHR